MCSATLKILSVNCQGLRDLKKCTDVLNYLTEQNPDILCLQDTHWVSEDLKSVKNYGLVNASYMALEQLKGGWQS